MSAPEFEDLVDDLVSNAKPSMIRNQYQFMLWMELTRQMSWDLPSALAFLCDHQVVTEEDFPGFGEFPMHREPQSYWEGLNPWPLLDGHFKDVHGFDLTDPHINWSFDT